MWMNSGRNDRDDNDEDDLVSVSYELVRKRYYLCDYHFVSLYDKNS